MFEKGARLLGHPIHPMLVVFPLGLLTTSLIFDIIALASGNGGWAGLAFWMIAAGVLGGLLAAVFGLIDWLAIPSGTRAKAVGLWHAITNVIVLTLFVISWFLRYNAPDLPGTAAVVLSFIGVGLAGVGGWLGGELVDRLGVGVDKGAHMDAPSSLSGRPATEDVAHAPAGEWWGRSSGHATS